MLALFTSLLFLGLLGGCGGGNETPPADPQGKGRPAAPQPKSGELFQLLIQVGGLTKEQGEVIRSMSSLEGEDAKAGATARIDAIEKELKGLEPKATELFKGFLPNDQPPFKEIEQTLQFANMVWSLKDAKGGYVSLAYHPDPEKFAAFKKNAKADM